MLFRSGTILFHHALQAVRDQAVFVCRYEYEIPNRLRILGFARKYTFLRLVISQDLFGPTLGRADDEDGLKQILTYNQAQERVLTGKSKDSQPVWYFVFITAYKDGLIPDRLQRVVRKERTLIHIAVMAPEKLEHNMEFVNAADMARALKDSGKIALYGIHFDTDRDTLRADSNAMLDEISRLLTSDPQIRLHVVGHTDSQGTPDHNLDLSRRRAATVVHALTSHYNIAPARLDSFGCGPYAPAASNADEDGRAKNRRVELVKW